MRFVRTIGSVLTLLSFFTAKGQADTAAVDRWMQKADDFYSRKSYDSALTAFNSALGLMKKFRMLEDHRAPIVYNFIGDIYKKKEDAEKAHQYLTLALEAARRRNNNYEKENALLGLLELHKTISRKSLPFRYQPVREVELSDVYFPVISITEEKDSLFVIIGAGRLDGLDTALKIAELYTHIPFQDTSGRKHLGYYGPGRIVSLDDNHLKVRVRKDAAKRLIPGDFTIIKSSVPLAWRKLFLRPFLLRDIYLQGNYRQPLYHYRYLYYYGDTLVEREIFSVMKTSVDEVVEAFGEDTLNNPTFAAINTGGIFEGWNVMRALHLSKPAHLRLFLNFVNQFPAKYIGNDYKFAETFATWVINKTPLYSGDIKPYLLGIDNKDERSLQAWFLREQIRSDQLIDNWLDEGMEQVNVENIREALKTARLMNEVSAIADTINRGWADYLFANIERKMSRPETADSFLRSAEQKFRASNREEGLDWSRNTRQQWAKNSQLTVGVQNGHILPYEIAQSNNPRYFATGGADNLVKIWDRTLSKEILSLREHTDEVTSLQYSPNGRYLASAGADSMIYVWNAYNYSLLYRYKSGTVERVVRFSPDNQFLVTGGTDSVIRFRELRTGKVVKTLALHKGSVNGLAFHPRNRNILYSAGSDSMVYKWDTDSTEMIHWYKHKGKALSVKLTNDGTYMSVVTTDSLVQVWNTELHRKILFGKIHTWQPGTLKMYAEAGFSPDSRFLAYPYTRDSFVVIRLSDIYQRSYPAEVKYSTLSELQFTNDGQALLARYDMGGPLRIYNFAGWDIKESPTISWKDIRHYGNLLTSVQFTKDDKGLVVLHSEISKLDLGNGSNERLFYGYSLINNPHLLLDDERIGTFIDNKKPTLYFYDYRKLERVKSFSLPEKEKISCWELAPGSTRCYIGSENGIVGGWNAQTGAPLFTRALVDSGEGEIRSMKYDPHNDRLYVVTGSKNFFSLDPVSGKTLHILPNLDVNYVTCSDRFIYATGNDGYLYKITADNYTLVKRIRLNDNGDAANQVAISSDHRFISLLNGASNLLTIRLGDDSILYDKKAHEWGATMLAISHDGKQVATSGMDSKINLYDALTGELLVNIHYPMEKDVLISDAEGHYLASRNTLDAISFTYNNNAFGFDQFDVKLNRPDIILAKIGRADSALLKAYYSAYRKRIDRLKITESELNGEMHLPLVRVQDRFAVQPATTDKEFELTIECSDSRYPLKSLQVLVNNTPLLGVTGLDLEKLSTRETVQKVRIPLSSGINSVKVYCTNVKGVSSLRESFDIISKYKAAQDARIYFIGIGAAQYKDSRMNLQYSAKDIRDLAKTFDNLYYDLSIDTLIDKKVTRENILALKKKLMKTTVNDRVILAVTGHGLLSDSLDFYYATWDVDFNKPEKRGVKYEELEDLLNDIPARQKLMLIDACHSGALDKEELLSLRSDTVTVVTAPGGDTTVKGIAPRGFGIKNKKQKMDANSSFEMMQTLFTDLSGGNGAIIISAAGGMEYAFESGQWNNGVFTYCVRKGIEEKAADTEGNLDGKVTVQELLRYVSTEVSNLTNGKQKPTSRRENIDFEWLIRN